MLLSALLLGVSLGIVYEVVRLLKNIFDLKRRGANVFLYFFTFLTDFLFILLFAATAILQTYKISEGIFRGLTYIGMFSGFALYYFTLGKLTAKISSRLAKFIRKTVKIAIKVVLVPFRAIFSLFFKIYTLTIGKIIGKIIRRVKEKSSQKRTPVDVAGLPAPLDMDREKGYKKEGRVSFGGKRET